MEKNSRLLLVFYIVGGSSITLFQRYLTFHFDNFTQNFFRFLSGAVALFLIAFIFHPAELRKLAQNGRHIFHVGIMSFCMVFGQFFFIEGLARTSAILAGLIATLGIPLTIILTTLLFPEEKKVFKNKWFVLGFLLATGGALGLPLAQKNPGGSTALGILYLLISIIIIAAVTVWLKKLLQDIHPLCLAGMNCGFTALFFLVGGIYWGNLTSVIHTAFLPNLVLVVSGVWGLVIGGWLAMVSIKRCGVVVTRLAELAMPVLIGMAGFILFRETLSGPGLLLGGLVLAGCGLVLWQQGRSRPAAYC